MRLSWDFLESASYQDKPYRGLRYGPDGPLYDPLDMWKIVVTGVILLVVMEGIALYALKVNKVEETKEKVPIEKTLEEEPQTDIPVSTTEKTPEPETNKENTSGMNSTSSSDYPKVTTEVVNGRTERTIHMGVRKWVWEPSTLRAKQGELVRLVIHNADVNHPLYIPELGIEAEVPPEGAVVEFEAKKKGNFFFLCGTYCGEGHAEMQGTLIID